MTAPPGFLADICEHPTDDGPRLVYADWLEEQGGAAQRDLSAFIRLQVRLESLPPYAPERFELQEREQDLLADHFADWLVPLPTWVRTAGPVFRKGFVGEVRLNPGRFLSHGARLARAVPLLKVTLDGLGNRPADLGESEALAGLAELELAGVPPDAARLRDFLGSFPGQRLRHLALTGKWGTRVGHTEFLSDWSGLTALKGLALRTMQFPDATLAKLLSSPHLRALERLELAGSGAGPETGSRLADLQSLRALRHLDLVPCTLTAGSARALAAADWPHIESLRIGAEASGDDYPGIGALLRAGWIANLRSL